MLRSTSMHTKRKLKQGELPCFVSLLIFEYSDLEAILKEDVCTSKFCYSYSYNLECKLIATIIYLNALEI
jgi:hypothetical protein